jgi:flagellar hook protein FlgE
MSLSSVASTALSGIGASETMLQVAAHNLANLQTAGFQSSQVVLTTGPVTGPSGRQIGTGVQVAAIVRDASPGALLSTAGSLQLAIAGEGYFVLEDSRGRRLYTRDGNFHLHADGRLVAADGQTVLGGSRDRNVFQGELVPLFILNRDSRTRGSASVADELATRLQIGRDGRLQLRLQDGTIQTIGQLRTARFANPGGLVAAGDNAWEATAVSGPPRIGDPGTAGWGSIHAWATEASNSDLGQNLVNISRAELLFRASLETLSVADRLWQELLALPRD